MPIVCCCCCSPVALSADEICVTIHRGPKLNRTCCGKGGGGRDATAMCVCVFVPLSCAHFLHFGQKRKAILYASLSVAGAESSSQPHTHTLTLPGRAIALQLLQSEPELDIEIICTRDQQNPLFLSVFSLFIILNSTRMS